MTARELHDDEYDAAWTAIKLEVPGFAEYETKTDRRIPVFALTRGLVGQRAEQVRRHRRVHRLGVGRVVDAGEHVALQARELAR